MKKYDFVITGTSGFIGTHLLHAMAFREPKSKILAIDVRDPSPSFPLLKNVGYLTCDVSDIASKVGKDEVEGAVTIHLAAQPNITICEQNPAEAIRQNVRVTKILLDFASLSKSFVFVSSVAATNPITAYGMTKLASEAICGHYGANVLRLHNVYGPGGKGAANIFVRAAVLGENIVVHTQTENNKYSFVHVNDVVDAIIYIVELGESDGRFVLGEGLGADFVTSSELAQTVLRESGSGSSIARMPSDGGLVPQPRKSEGFISLDSHVKLRAGIAGLASYERIKIAKKES